METSQASLCLAGYPCRNPSWLAPWIDPSLGWTSLAGLQANTSHSSQTLEKQGLKTLALDRENVTDRVKNV